MKNIKRHIYWSFVVFVATIALFSCSEDEGTELGNDPNPAVTIYKYTPGEAYSVDNDIVMRFAFNNKTTSAYLMVEKTVDKEAYITSSGESAYLDYVTSNGTQLDVDGEANIDTTLVGLYGKYSITVVAVGKDSKSSAETVFTGLEYLPYAEGTYTSVFFGDSWPATLEYESNVKQYRFKDCWVEGYNLIFTVSDDGTITQIPSKIETGYVHPTYGLMVSVAAQDGSVFDSSEELYTFAFKWTISLGSFGVYNDSFQITSKY